MSRIGKNPITLPSGVQVNASANLVEVSGPAGKLTSPLFPGLELKNEGGKITISRNDESKEIRAKHGLVRALLANNILGVTKGFTRTLLLQGVGYRAAKKGKQLVMSLGYSHEVIVDEPSDLKFEVPEPTKVIISGIDKQKVGQAAAKIRSFRPPEPYKGKGIRYENEVVRRKAGKAGKK